MLGSAGLQRLTIQIQEEKDTSNGVGGLSRRTIPVLRSVLLSLHQEKPGSKTQWGLQVALIVEHIFRFLWPWVQGRGAA